MAVWGLSFKAGTDDRRGSLATDIVARLVDAGDTRVRAYDPTVSSPVPDLPDTVVVAGDPYDACVGAEVVAVLTDWDELTKVDLHQIRETMATARMVDARNLFDSGTVRDADFDYVGLGNP